MRIEVIGTGMKPVIWDHNGDGDWTRETGWDEDAQRPELVGEEEPAVLGALAVLRAAAGKAQ